VARDGGTRHEETIAVSFSAVTGPGLSRVAAETGGTRGEQGFHRHRRRCRPRWRRQMKWVETGRGHTETFEKNRSIPTITGPVVHTVLALSTKNQRLLETNRIEP